MQYDNIKEELFEIKIRDSSSKPSANLLGICNKLIAGEYRNNYPWIPLIEEFSKKLRDGSRPKPENDILKKDGIVFDHPKDEERESNIPRVFHGPIGSANTLLKNEKKRDFLGQEYSVKAIEMEGSGVADGTWSFSKGYLIVRGIVDYCNDDKNDIWQNYGAVCAAAYAKCIIQLT